jgi:outer membrane receptor protein involved in Fe transport
MMKCLMRRSLITTLMLCFPAVTAFGQGTATVFGQVSDASGAVIPGVRVTVTNVNTNARRETIADEQGGFLIASLPVGVYRVEAEQNGFKRYVEQNVQLQVDERRAINVTMQAGAISESISVTSNSVQVETRSGALKEVIDSARIVQLPLNGRNALELQRLVPGAGGVAAADQAQNQSLSVNGSRTNSNNYSLDGGDNHDPYFNTPAVFPNPDALQEFSIQTSSYSAATGRNAGAVINAVTKSGTNQFHGSAFEFLRNEKLNARSFFALTTPPFKRNQFGGAFGGPVKRDQTFFFVAYQGWRERSAPGTVTAIVPTAEQRRGNLAGLGRTIRDPLTGQPFPGNVIPGSRLHPASQKFLEAFVPLPNAADGRLITASGERFDQDQVITKIDHHLTRDNTLTGRLLWNADTKREATGNLPGFFAAIEYANWNVAITDTHVFSPALLNVVRFTFNDIDRRQLPVTPGDVNWIDFGAKFTRTFKDDAPSAIHTVLDGYFTAFTRFPLNHFRQNYNFADDLTWTRGNHQLQLGGSLTRSILDLQELFRGDPFVQFRNNFTGDALADFLLGRPSQVEQIAEDANNPRAWEIGLYAQDDWKASQRLTLNLGLRWEPYLPFTDPPDRFSQFRSGAQSSVFPTAPRGNVFPGDAGISDSMLKRRFGNFAPRFGFAWDIFGNGKTGLRGGYGVFYSQIRQQAHNQISTNQPFSLKLTINDLPQGLDNPYAATGNPFPFELPAGDAARNYRFIRPLAITMFDPDFRNAVVQQWNLNVQQELFGSYVFTAAYVASKGNHLFMQQEVNPARPGAGAVNARRIYAPDFANITNQTAIGNSTYHSLQLSVNKRFTNSFTLLASHTWSKLLDNASADGGQPANPYDLRAEKGLSGLDVAHRFVASFVYELPKFNGAPGLVRHTLGGWQMNGIVALQSGIPFSVVSGRDNSQSGVNQDRANLVGEPKLDAGRSHQELIDRYFNTAAFAQNPTGAFGTAGRNILRGPGFANVDFGLGKDVPLFWEGHRLQFRGEFFNLFNRVNFANPNNNLSSAQFGRITGTAGAPRVIQFGLKYVF